jgi:hypothetical protein
MKITISRLKKIIQEEIELLLCDVKEIEEKKSKLPKSKCGKKGNPYHSAKTGEFYDPKTGGKGSFSRWFQCAEDGRTRMPGGSYKRLAISQPDNCGRSAREKGKDRKCSEPGKKKKE